jgi:excisionase family DNA binding protein
MGEFLTTGQAAARLHLSRETVRRAIELRLIPAWRTPRGHWRLAPEDVGRLLTRVSTAEHPGAPGWLVALHAEGVREP